MCSIPLPAVNEQINIEYQVSYVYHALYAFFDRDNVGLPGFAKYFKVRRLHTRRHTRAHTYAGAAALMVEPVWLGY